MDQTPTTNEFPRTPLTSISEEGSDPDDVIRLINFSYVFNATSSIVPNSLKFKHWIPARFLIQSLGSNLRPHVNDLFNAILDAMIKDEAEVLRLSDNRCVACGKIPRAGAGWTVWFTDSPSGHRYGFIHNWVYLVCGHECDRALVWGMINRGPPGHDVNWFWRDVETVVMWRNLNTGEEDSDDSATVVPDIVVTQGD